jgi:hypothetical protein
VVMCVLMSYVGVLLVVVGLGSFEILRADNLVLRKNRTKCA